MSPRPRPRCWSGAPGCHGPDPWTARSRAPHPRQGVQDKPHAWLRGLWAGSTLRPPGWSLSSGAGSTRPDRPSPRRERLVHELDTTGELLVDLGSDQTSCHNPFNGGYYPVQLGFAEAQSLMASDPTAFKSLVQER